MVSMGDVNVKVRGQFMGFVISFCLSLGSGSGTQITCKVIVIWLACTARTFKAGWTISLAAHMLLILPSTFCTKSFVCLTCTLFCICSDDFVFVLVTLFADSWAIQHIYRYRLGLFSCVNPILASHVQPWADCTHFFLLIHLDYLPCPQSLPFIATGWTVRLHSASDLGPRATELTSQLGFKFTSPVSIRHTKP